MCDPITLLSTGKQDNTVHPIYSEIKEKLKHKQTRKSTGKTSTLLREVTLKHQLFW